MDVGRDKSDTQVVLKMKWSQKQTEWSEVDHTEVVHDNLDPNYEHSFDLVLNFGQEVRLRFEVVDLDSDGSTEQIGYIEVTLADLLKVHQIEKPLQS